MHCAVHNAQCSVQHTVYCIVHRVVHEAVHCTQCSNAISGNQSSPEALHCTALCSTQCTVQCATHCLLQCTLCRTQCCTMYTLLHCHNRKQSSADALCTALHITFIEHCHFFEPILGMHCHWVYRPLYSGFHRKLQYCNIVILACSKHLRCVFGNL